MEEEYNYYYKLREKIKNGVHKISRNDDLPEYLLLAPDLFYLLIKLMQDPEVPKSKKVKLGAVIAYFITPFDFLPEAIMGLVAYVDDVALTAYVLNDFFNEMDPAIIKDNWPGEKKLLTVIQNILEDTDQFINKNIVNRLKKFIDKDNF
jgi:uncharacterized membrane protein YkvA (DUF1232 family)